VARPFWSGEIRISLVSFGVKLFPATEAKSEIHFHQINRKSGERVRHQNVSESDETPVGKNDIVKGYEYSKGDYVQIEPEEIEHLRIPSRHTLELQQFVSLEELDPGLYEKPYFVVPEEESQAEAFSVVRKALQESKKAGLGKIAMGGREHLMAITAPSDTRLDGLMAYTLRYAVELRSAKEYFSGIKSSTTNAEGLSLAKELIQRKTGKFDPSKFTDNYEAALRNLVEAKLKHLPLPIEKMAPHRGKEVNLMDALRRSVSAPEEKTQAARSNGVKAKHPTKNGLTLVKGRTKRADKRRKTA
jgi:DNA end-binding protein Ku